MHTSEYDYLFKLLLIGDSGVGKVSGYAVTLLPQPQLSDSLLVLPASPFRR